jgi:release factor glutamine methyltransferase
MAREAAARLDALIASRAHRTPLQHLLGLVEFRGLQFAVNEDVLIPRPETEDLVQAVIDAGLPEFARLADFGTGSGCIAIALAVERPVWKLVAVERSAAALRVATRNAARHGVADTIEFVESDFAAPEASWSGSFDAVVSNPPYISEEEWRDLEPEVRDHEPKGALVPGPTGNEAYAAVVRAAGTMLRSGGLLALELGWKSSVAVRLMVTAGGFRDIDIRPDFQGIPRVLTARR